MRGRPSGYREIRMFGGLCWTVNTHMAVGTGEDDLMVHVGTTASRTPSRSARAGRRWGSARWAGWSWSRRPTSPTPASLDAWVAPAVARALARPPKTPGTAHEIP